MLEHTSANKIDYLSTIQIFRDLSQTDLQQMDRQTVMSTCQPGKIFYAPEDTAEVLFLLKKGRVQLYRLSSSGKKIVVATLGPGAIFGEMALFGQRMHSTFAQALDECTLCVMGRADVERLVQEKPDVAFRLVQILGQRVTELETRLENIAFKSIPARLADLILRLAREQGDGTLIRGYTHQDLGEILGTYRETTTQTLNEFRLHGLIEIGRKRLTILDKDALRVLAES